MPRDCLITERIYASCAVPPDHPVGNVCHVWGDKLYCERHCVGCHPGPHEFTEPMPTGAVTGEQEKLVFWR